MKQNLSKTSMLPPKQRKMYVVNRIKLKAITELNQSSDIELLGRESLNKSPSKIG